MSKKNFFLLLLLTACFVWITPSTAKAAKPYCGDGKCSNKENSCNCELDCGQPPSTETNCSDGTDNDCDELIDCDDQEDCGEDICGPAPFCGDEACNGDETCSSCEADCGVCPPVPDELQLRAEQTAAHDGDTVRAVGFATDEAGGTWIVSGGEDAHLRNWTPQLDVQLDDQTLNHTIYDLDVDGSIVVTGEGGWNGHANSDTLRIWDADGFLVGTQAPIGFVYCVAISPDNLWTVASGFYGDIVVYDIDNLELYATKATKKKRTKALAFSPDGSVLASTSTAGRIQLWSFPEECTLESCELDLLPVSLSHSGSWVFPIAFKPNSTSDVTKIVSGTDGGMIKVWTIENLTSAKPDASVRLVDSRAVYSLAWSPDETMIVAGGDGDITVYDTGILEILFQNVNAHAGRVNDVVFSPDSSQIVSGGADGTLKLWDLVGAP